MSSLSGHGILAEKGGEVMKIPPFADFKQSIDFEKLTYDLTAIATQELKESSTLFTADQYRFLTSTVATMSLALFQQYHQWLAEQLDA